MSEVENVAFFVNATSTSMYHSGFTQLVQLTSHLFTFSKKVGHQCWPKYPHTPDSKDALARHALSGSTG
jgi:hypothetical protein